MNQKVAMINDKLKNEKILDLTLHEIMEIVDNKARLKYTYLTKGFIKWFPIPKEDKDAN